MIQLPIKLKYGYTVAFKNAKKTPLSLSLSLSPYPLIRKAFKKENICYILCDFKWLKLKMDFKYNLKNCNILTCMSALWPNK